MSTAAVAQRDTSRKEFFETSVRPLLVEKCFGCHSGTSAKAGVNLDSAIGLTKATHSGPLIVAANPVKSLILRVVRAKAGVPAMPPDTRLSAREVATIEQWVKQGAYYPAAVAKNGSAGPTWAFRPVKANVALPPVHNSVWARTPIDRFILAKLEAKGLSPSPEADRRSLLRRATYDLTGLPPTPEETASFLADRSSGSYERLVDRLLASPRYGERWARHWLDVVHYGDTHGYDKDKRRDNAWPYRDYVISAFNSDLPYSKFVQQQVAGDVLFPDDPSATVATGMLAAGPWDFVGNLELAEGTVEKEKTRLIDRDDTVANVIETFDSVTIHCARCHDHKFDPIPQRDYYRLQAVFAGIDKGDRPYYNRANMILGASLQAERNALTQQRDSVNREIQAITSPEIQQLDTRIADARNRLGALPTPVVSAGSPSNGYHSDISASQDVERWVQVDLGKETEVDSVRLIPARPTDFKDSPGFGFPVRFKVTVSNTSGFSSSVEIANNTATDFANPGDSPVAFAAPGVKCRYVRVTATKLWPRSNDFVFALAELQVFRSHQNIALLKPAQAQESIEQGRWSVKFLTDNYDSRNALPDLTNPAVVRAVTDREAAQTEVFNLRQQRNQEVEKLIPAASKAERSRLKSKIEALDAKIAALPPPSQVFSVVPRAPRPIWVLNRGDVEAHGESVRPGALSAVPGVSSDFGSSVGESEGAARAALANWIVNPANTLTWRSIVNRVWSYHFTRGIVDTPDDFGKNSGEPSHPELLDWLATWFRQNGQSIKKLHRMIMLSTTYRQSSDAPAVSRAALVDADNRLLWRMNSRRLEAEEIRDSILAFSGKLKLTVGGPGFEPFRFKDDHSPIYDYADVARATDPTTFRRTVYEFIVRSVPDPFLDSLDSADPNARTPVRNTTLTALQALTLRNDPFMLSQSAAMAQRLSSISGSLDMKIDFACKLIYGRPPGIKEKSLLKSYGIKHGVANLCRTLINTNEFMFVP